MLSKTIAFALVTLSVFVSITSAKRRIYGGVYTEIQNFPWIVAVLHYGNSLCGGSIISEYFVMTAGHCVDPYRNTQPWPLTVKYGTNRPFQANSGTVVQIKFYYVHPNHRNINDHELDDIAILQLYNPIIFSAWARQITLRSSPAQSWEAANVAGWGKGEHGDVSSVLKITDVFVFDWIECQRRSQNTPYFTSNQICTLKPGKGPCYGDSGGPLVVNNVQVGIVSYGFHGCNDDYYPLIYTNVANYKGFIDSSTKYTAVWSR